MICPHTKKSSFQHDSRCIYPNGHPECNCGGKPKGQLIPMFGGCCGMECYLEGGGRACPPPPGSKPVQFITLDGDVHDAMETTINIRK